MSNLLYEENADLYFLIANDRDFYEECKSIVVFFTYIFPSQKIINSLELFSGPAYHSSILASDFCVDTKCIDASSAMRDIALENSSLTLKNYEVGFLPDCLSIETNYNLVFVMRYSIGLLNPSGLKELLNKLADLVSNEGIILFELHQQEMIKTDFQHLEIKDRSYISHDKTKKIRCAWPSSSIKKINSLQIEMPIRLEIESHDGKIDTIHTLSVEYLYDKEYIISLLSSENIPLKPVDTHTLSATFPQSDILVLRRD